MQAEPKSDLNYNIYMRSCLIMEISLHICNSSIITFSLSGASTVSVFTVMARSIV